MAFFSKNVAVDLGTVNVVIYVQGQGIVLREPAIAAVSDDEFRDVFAIGLQAKQMMSKTLAGIKAVYPLREGIIADIMVTEEMLSQFLARALGRKSIVGASTRVVMCVPCSITKRERQIVEKTVKNCGAKEVFITEQPMAAAIGAGLPVNSIIGSMVVDIGGGSTEIAVISMSEIVISRSLRVGGIMLDRDIAYYVNKNYHVIIGERTAEEVKMEIGSAMDYKDTSSIHIRGRNATSYIPETIELTSRQICDAMRDTIDRIVLEIRAVLEHTSPEIASDIMQYGITLTGGGASLSGMADRITFDTQIPVKIADAPLDCVARGAGIIAEQLDELKKSRRTR